MIRFLKQLRTLSLYFLIPAVGAVSPLVVIPAISSQFGAAAWASVAIGQSVGMAAAVVAELGWGVVGPQQVARSSFSGRIDTYRLALSSRILSVLVLTPLVGVVSFLIALDYRAEVALLAVGTAMTALSPAWFFVGSGTPLRVLVSESLPRLSLSVACAVAITLGSPLLVYALTIFALPVLSLVIARLILGRNFVPNRLDFRQAPSVFRSQGVIALGRAISVVYTALPIALIGAFVPTSVTLYAASDRLMRMALALLAGVPSRLQNWLGSPTARRERDRRVRATIAMNLILGIVSGVGFALLVSPVSQLVFAGTIDIPPPIALLSGSVLSTICLSRGMGLALVAVGKPDSITRAIFASAIVGGATIVPLSFALGAAGAIIGVLSAEVTGVVVQGLSLRRYRRLEGETP